MKSVWLVILGIGLILVLIACGAGTAPTSAPETTPGDKVEQGRELFQTGGDGTPCASCHSLDGSEGSGPSLQGIGQVAGERVPGQTAADYLREAIVDPSAYIVPGYSDRMSKRYGSVLSDDEIDSLIAFLLSQ